MKKSFSRKLLAVLLVLVMVLSILPTAFAAGYTDVKEDSWYKEYVDYCQEKGLMNGRSDTQFAPDANATRAELATVLYRMAGSPETAFSAKFSDVLEKNWFAIAVTWAAAEEIVKGYPDGTFLPNKPATRQEIVTMIYRYVGDKTKGETSDLKEFKDTADVKDYALEAIKWAVGAGIIGGSKESNGLYLFPGKNALRSEIAKMMAMLNQYLATQPTTPTTPTEPTPTEPTPTEPTATEPTPCEHVWDDGEITTPATCATVGVMTYTCTLCGETKTEDIPIDPNAHHYVDGVCTYCGDALAQEGDIVIYYTNDVHTYIDGELSYDNIADLKRQTAAIADGTLLLDAGDHAQGTAYGSMDKGAKIIDMMTKAGYDAATLGNHEFDYGMERTMEIIDDAGYPYLSCNFYHEDAGEVGETVLDAYRIFYVGGKKIAVIGITTPESFTKSTPAYFQDGEGNYIYGIAGGTDGQALYDTVQATIDKVSDKVDYVIALGHLGVDPASAPWTSEEVIANTTGLDAFIDGHSHSTVESKQVDDKDGNKVLLTQTGSYFDAIGKMTINADGISTELIKAYNGSKANVKRVKDDWIAEVNEKLGEVIGTTDVIFNNYDADGNRLVRKQETNTGDFAADALYYLFDNMGLDVDVAIMNGGGVRNKAVTGDLSYLSCKSIHTFGNVACLQTVTGQQILDALEWGARDVGNAECGGFLQVSGVKYEINTYAPNTVQKDDKGVWTGGPTDGYRVQNVKILQAGEWVDLDLTASYNLAGYNYTLRDLGDGFAMFDGAVNVLDYVMEDYMVLANYIKSFPVDETTGLPTITEETVGINGATYGALTGDGRITVNGPLSDAGDITIYYTNDVHTYIDESLSYDTAAALKANTENALLVDAGDHAQGTAYGSMDKGETIIQLMNAAGYDAATLGNHEFDYGMDRTLEIVEEAEFPYLSCNFYHEEAGVAGDPVLDAYKIFEVGGKKVAIIGITTPESFTKSTPAYFQDDDGNYIYGIAGGTDGQALYDTVQATIDAAVADGADYIIALGHLGVDSASSPWMSTDVIAHTSGLDAFIDGHSHSTVVGDEVADKDGNKVLLTQTGSYYGAIGKMTIDAQGAITTELITDFPYADSDVTAIKNEWIAEVDELLGEVIGTTDVSFNNYDADGNRLVRKQETNTGDFAADALYYLFDNMDLDVDVAIMNGGGVRNREVTGDLSYLSCKSIHTFGNVACLQTVTGQQILDALEWGARDVGTAECGGFLQVSGLTYEINAYVPNTVQKDDKGVWSGGPTGDYRVQNVKILQEGEWVDLDLAASYNLAGYNYTLRDLGDGFAMFDGAVNVLDYVMEDYMVLANYIKSFPVDETTGLPTITAESVGINGATYGELTGDGRITVNGSLSEDGDITIYYTNDVHTYIDKSLSYDTAAYLKANTPDSLLVDAGDHIQGTAFGSMDKGATIIELMNAAGYDAATLGNHEFDYGMDRTLEIVEEAAFPYLSCNFYHEEAGVAGASVLDAYKIFNVADKKVAIIGITTPESFTKSTPAYFQDDEGNYIYGIAGGTDGQALYDTVQATIDAAAADGADYIIALGHLGIDPASAPWTSKELIAHTSGLDAFIDGHSHSEDEGELVADKDNNMVLLTQTGSYYGAIGKMTINADGITTELITGFSYADADVAEIKDTWIGEVNDQLGEIIGTTDVLFNNYDADNNRLVRKQETNTGDFAADALYYLFDNMGLDVDVAIMNGGGVRNKEVTGDLSYLSCKNIHTFGNVACLQTVTGQQILDALEWGSRYAGAAEGGGFLQVSGLTYEVDTTIPNGCQQDSKGVWTAGPETYRVKNVKILQEGEWVDLNLAASYNLAGYNYTLRDLGDGFAMFDGAVNVLDYVMEDYMVLANYVKAFPIDATSSLPYVGATNSPLNDIDGFDVDYAELTGNGRINVILTPPEPWDGEVEIGGCDLTLWFSKYGNTWTDCSAAHFLEAADNGLDFDEGDIVTVSFLDQAIDLPVGTNYSDVDSGTPMIKVNAGGYVELAINMGNFAHTYGLAVITKNADNTYSIAPAEGVTYPVEVTFTLKEAGGYADELLMHRLVRTNVRADYQEGNDKGYPDLDDAEFANFRAVATTGMGTNVLYRSSSPVDPSIGRNTYADDAMEAAGIATVMNLANDQATAEAYTGFADTYYSGQDIAYLNLGVDFTASDFQAGLKTGIEYFINHDGPYLVHCTEGKDRAGFVTALLECFMGADYNEIVTDYMQTYYNYYGVEAGSEKYIAIAQSNIVTSLKNAFEIDDFTTANLQAEATAYFKQIGLTDAQLEALAENLG